MNKLFFIFALLLLNIDAHAEEKVKKYPKLEAPEVTPVDEMPGGEYYVDPLHQTLLWRISHGGLSSYTARFTNVKGTLDFNPEDPLKSKVTISIDPKSVRTDYDVTKKHTHKDAYIKRDWDKELADDPMWFDSGKHPEIKFVSTKIEKTGKNTGILHGDLTMLGITKPVTLKAVYNGAWKVKPFDGNPVMGFSATGKIKRSDWSLMSLLPGIGDEVEIIIEIEFIQNKILKG